MTNRIVELTANNYRSQVLRQDGVPVLVDYWAIWCGPCRMMTPTLESLAEEFQGRAVIAKVDIDKEKTLAAIAQIRSIPTLVLFKNGAVQDVFVGVTPRTILRTKILEAAGAPAAQPEAAAAPA
jgi:thioredoxin 1